MTILTALELTRSYGARTVLDGVSLTLEAGDRVGLIGPNGGGKSTLGRILAGVEEADTGSVVRRRAARVGYLPQEPVLGPDDTARSAVLAGLAAWKAARTRYDEIAQALAKGDGDVTRLLAMQADAAGELEHLGGYDRDHDAQQMLTRVGIDGHDRKVRAMSGGERRRVDLARLLVARPDLAILDEPTNHLDVDTIEWLETHLRDEQPGAILLITHDRFFLDRVVRRTAELDRGKLVVYEGGYEAYLEAKAERDAHEARHEQNRQNLIRRELDWLRRSAPARTTKQKARIDRATDVIAQKGPARAKATRLELDSVRSGNSILDLHHVKLTIGDRVLVDDLDLALVKGERVGILGPNGAGKTTLLRAILGEAPVASGRIDVGKNTRITYFGQSREGLDLDKTIVENVTDAGKVTLGGRTMDVRAYLERFLFDAERQRQPVKSLSGGEKARVLLAKLLLVPTNLLILDEPTNDLDVTTLASLEELLLELDGTALVVTHDRWFLDRVATSILAFEGRGKVVRYAGGYTLYRELTKQREQAEAAAPPAVSPRPKSEEPKGKKRALTYAERLELDGLLDRVGEAEAEVAALEAQLSDPATYGAGGTKAADLAAQLDRARAELETRMARWEELETKKNAESR